MKKFTFLFSVLVAVTFAFAQAPARLTKQDLLTPQKELQYDKLTGQQKRSIVGTCINGVARISKKWWETDQSQAWKAPQKEEAAEYPEVDPTVIAEQPEGELKTYSRSGGAFVEVWGYVMNSTQDGIPMDIVTSPDGKTVYLKDIVSGLYAETWAKGTIEGNKIHVPLYQSLLYDAESANGYCIAKCDYDRNTGTYKPDFTATEMTYTINEDGTISLDGTSEMVEGSELPMSILAILWSNNFAWSSYGDWMSVYTEFNDVVKTMPEEVNVEDWSYLYDYGNMTYGKLLKAGVSGDKLYIQGLSEDDPETVIEGTISGDKVTFASDQYLGSNSGFLSYFSGSKVTVETKYDAYYDEYYDEITYNYSPKLVMNYDAEKKSLTSAADDALVVNCGKASERIYYMTVGVNPRFGYFEDVAATPADPAITKVDEFMETYGYDCVHADVKVYDLDGKFINTDNVKYILWVKVDNTPEPFVFYADEYYSFKADGLDEITEVPYKLTATDANGYYDIDEGGTSIYIYQSGFDDYGIQTIYYGGGERKESNISWYSEVTAISDASVKAGEKVKAVYSIDGKQLSAPVKGLNILRMSDGSVRKVMIGK